MGQHSLYIASVESGSGSFSIALGLMELLQRNYGRVAFFKPLIKQNDSDIVTMIEHYGLSQKFPQSYGYDIDTFLQLAAKDINRVYEGLIEKYNTLAKEYDFVLIQGVSKDFISKIVDFDINFALAKHLASAFIPVLNAENKTPTHIIEDIRIEADHIRRHRCSHFATFVNKVAPARLPALQKEIGKIAREYELYLLPENEQLGALSISEVVDALQCRRIHGRKRGLKRLIHGIALVSERVEHFIAEVKAQSLIVTSSDRSDIVLAALNMAYAKGMPTVAGILLTGKQPLPEAVARLINGYEDLPIPVLQMPGDAFTAAQKIVRLKPKIGLHNKNKIALSNGIFFNAVDTGVLEQKLREGRDESVTPLMFQYGLFERAKAKKKTIILPESEDERILKACEILLHRGIVSIILVGQRRRIEHDCALHGVDIGGARIIDPAEFEQVELLADNLYEKRKHKGLHKQQALEIMKTDPTYFATAMVDAGFADGMVSGAIHTTADTVRPALQLIKTQPGVEVVSSVFFMCLETRVLVYGDCAINKDPDAGELAAIAVSSAHSARRFGIEPRVAMLSYSTGDSGSGEMIEKVKRATALAKQRAPEFPIEGPLQYDAAIDQSVGEQKMPGSAVAGKATVFIFPDLNTGNNTYKAVQRSSGAVAIGPVLQGLNKPVNDLSRGCRVEDIVNTVAITAIQAQGE